MGIRQIPFDGFYFIAVALPRMDGYAKPTIKKIVVGTGFSIINSYAAKAGFSLLSNNPLDKSNGNIIFF